MYFLSYRSHSPLSQLPIEILTKIFHLASIGDPNLSFQQQKIALLKITWVTRHWRIVVLDCPRFWSTIHIGFDTEYYDWVGNKQRKVELRYPRVCVYRSKGVPISLFVDPTQLGKARTTQFLKDLLTKTPCEFKDSQSPSPSPNSITRTVISASYWIQPQWKSMPKLDSPYQKAPINSLFSFYAAWPIGPPICIIIRITPSTSYNIWPWGIANSSGKHFFVAYHQQ
ncbi:hypothetical protein BDN72DRAFT_961396 [Pluteus cervinus]|uniref:Uncharacterized protein n=1 Tax=Pluteus cervinus TaxID=181527 RepID=A0ACD3AN69_9AGAR|nr:hypothetical protein BDN72DRAFT_961396 [Pluteus cervinus]